MGFEPTISAGERPKTYALDRTATGTCRLSNVIQIPYDRQTERQTIQYLMPIAVQVTVSICYFVIVLLHVSASTGHPQESYLYSNTFIITAVKNMCIYIYIYIYIYEFTMQCYQLQYYYNVWNVYVMYRGAETRRRIAK